MSLLDKFKQKLSEMNLGQKLAAIILIPIAVIGVLLRLKDVLKGISEDSERARVDKKAKDMEEKIKKTSIETAKAEGRLQALEDAKKSAAEASGSQDPVSFHNSRKK